MKKWFEYQLEHQVIDRDWDHSYRPYTNISAVTDPYIQELKDLYNNLRGNKDPVLHDDHNLVGSIEYADYVAETYDDPVIKANIHDWCRDPEYLSLIDHHSLFKIYIREIKPDLCRDIFSSLGLQEQDGRIALHIQPPGSISPLHIDSIKSLNRDRQCLYKVNQDPDYIRYMVFLEDWQWGQVWQFGTEFVKWKSGDVFYWRLNDVPHATANAGYHTRFSFLVKGRPIA